MDYLPDIFAAADGQCDVTNAFAFQKETIFILINAMSEEEELEGSALLKVNLGADQPTYEVLLEFNSGSLDYYAESASLHYVLASGGYIHRLEGGEYTFHNFAAPGFHNRLARLDARTVVVFGEDGAAFRFFDGAYTQMPTQTEETLFGMHFPRPDFGYACGNHGTFLRSDGTSFTPVDLGGAESLRAIRVKADGTVILGCNKGVGLVVQGDELIRVEGNEADFLSVTEFQGMELWGDDDYGVYTRDGTAFVPKFQTGYAFNMNPIGDLLTINAGYDVYIYDGSGWIRLKINPDIENLIERVPLDFTPL